MFKPPTLDSRDHTKEGLSWDTRDYKSLVICPSSHTSTECVSILGVTGWGAGTSAGGGGKAKSIGLGNWEAHMMSTVYPSDTGQF